MNSKLIRLAHRQRRFQIGLEHIGGWRQDIGDEVIAELDVGIERPTNLELAKRVSTAGDDSHKAEDEQNAEENDR
ncbi:hypothetical protein [Bradyrhizobium japonicum]|uniref:hypothetical protein n=1 Tax=Bradyrhizobium japonicum TaxID=375 RepID=UPI002011C191|nr:hypothetical protein [Bradyrhizobium japonicum]